MPYFTVRGPVPLELPATTVFLRTMSGVAADLAGFTIVQTFPASSLDPATGTQIRLTCNFTALDATNVVAGYFGKRATVGDDYDFASTPVHILFNGTDIVGDGVTLIWVSDWIALGAAYDESVAYIFAWQNAGGAGHVTAAQSAPSSEVGSFTYSKAGVMEAATVDKTAYSGFSADSVYMVSKIEIR